MSYIGRQNLGGAYRQLDDISSGFDGSDTTHTMQVNSQNVTVGDVNQIILSLGGVIQKPGTDFTVSGSVLTFTTAPAANTSFFAVLLGSDNGGTVTPTDGSVTTTKIADDAITAAKVADDIAITTSGAITANGGLVADNITIDGTEIDLSSGDLTIDVAGNIVFDADTQGSSDGILLKDGGTHYGSIFRSGSDLNLKSIAQDEDIKFLGNNGGTEITALTLDMSGDGAAYFKAFLAVGNSSNTRARITGALDVDGNTFSIASGLRGLDDRDPKPSNFSVGIMGNFANYAGDGGGSPYADVLVFDTFGHSSAGNATALFISKADPNDIKLAQQTTRSTSTFTSGTQVNIDTSSISDASVKENVQDITGALDKIAQLRPVTFEWTDEYINNGLSKNAEEKVFTEGTLATLYTDDDELPEGKKVGDVKTEGVTPTRIIPDTKVTNVGLIAQEVEKVIPTVVHQNRVSLAGSTDYQKNIDYDKLVPHLIGAIKELKAKVEALESA